MASFERTIEFFARDFPRTLFPLDTNRVLIESSATALADHIYAGITHKKNSDESFLQQVRVYAAKPGFHLRRTAKLDPIAEFFLYDLAYRNRTSFRKSPRKSRENFGYRFVKGGPISPATSYRQFKAKVHRALDRYTFCVKCDVSSYFNSIYHHDLVNWFNDIAKSEEDAQFFDKFLKQTNSGRSIDCLPHGIYPAKMIGSHFLSFVDSSSLLNSDLMLRFMDDLYFFSNDYDGLIGDFLNVQRMLGDKGLSINPVKTKLGEIDQIDLEREIDEIKIGLLNRRSRVITGSGADDEVLEDEDESLNEEEVEYLFSLLKDEQIEEEDAELILALMRDYGSDVLEYMPTFLERFPNLSKNIYYFCDYVDDKETLSTVVSRFITESEQVTEYQLFWLAKLFQDQLLEASDSMEILSLLFEHPNATDISRAKLLEIPEKLYGLSELREEQLRTGASGWMSWSSAVGARVERKSKRNHLLSYFANGSKMNSIIATCIKQF